MNLTVLAYIMALLVCIGLPQALNVYFNSRRSVEAEQ